MPSWPRAEPGGRAKADGEGTYRQCAAVDRNRRHQGAIAGLGTGQLKEARYGQRRHVTAVAVSRGGKTGVTGTKDEEEPACSWELTTGKLIRRLGPGDGRESWIAWCAAFILDSKAVPWPTRARGLPSGTSRTAESKSSASPGVTAALAEPATTDS